MEVVQFAGVPQRKSGPVDSISRTILVKFSRREV